MFEEGINTDPKKTVFASEIRLFYLLLRKFSHSWGSAVTITALYSGSLK